MNDGDSASDHEEKTPYSLHSGDERRGLNRRRANFSPAVIWLNSIEELVIVDFAATSIVRSPASPPPTQEKLFRRQRRSERKQIKRFPGNHQRKAVVAAFQKLKLPSCSCFHSPRFLSPLPLLLYSSFSPRITLITAYCRFINSASLIIILHLKRLIPFYHASILFVVLCCISAVRNAHSVPTFRFCFTKMPVILGCGGIRPA